MDIEELIPYRKENAISRSELVLLMGCSDRKVRRKIETARRKGAVIINDQSGNGYYRPTIAEYEDALHQYRQEHSRAIKILVANKGLKNWLEDVKHGRLKRGDDDV